MTDIIGKKENADWLNTKKTMPKDGYAIISNLLSEKNCDDLKSNYDNSIGYRKTIVTERYRLGSGAYKYFDYPLPYIIQTIRTRVYPKLAPVANTWLRALNIDRLFPQKYAAFKEQCNQNGQQKATELILKYGRGGFNTLHQDLYGNIDFPIQIVFFLKDPEKDFTGGEFVMTRQIPGAQSKITIIKPRKGDAFIFTTNFNPKKGKKGYYSVNIKHAVSDIKSGERDTSGIIFHNATS